MYFVFLQKDLQGDGIFGIHQFEKGENFYVLHILAKKIEKDSSSTNVKDRYSKSIPHGEQH